ncbi:deoxyguanosinetriphosphate triphosphohydrolase family protein [Paenimyroides baculatum]|uniref:DNTP triphosphohydrolase n=1 Tax=Paenimyroides baculatum TaxID=2608000 RepID=A0A5M6C9U4_9FLAO|nr:dNTP triphosphohydrolase [Paenimyroides baculatum]KAA5531888.1 dNTP triphosphohydrolase [Paenimyroides baculatum]
MKELYEYVREKENQLKEVSEIRVNNKYKANVSAYRSNADVDYSRVLYSSAFRRLQGKMQLFIPKSDAFYRNRLTHSNEVAQIAKTISKKLKLSDILTVQTCSLAHDIGNPPFGHAGEKVLSKCSKIPYEGNAQTFRILRYIEERHYDFNGLNLTIRTMLGIVKYFNSITQNKKKFLYDNDYDIVKEWFEIYKINHKTIDCEIMDISDEIAYAVHDLEDGLKLKYFTIDELLYEFSISPEYKDATEYFNSIVISAKEFAEKAEMYKTSEEYSMLFRKELTSKLVNCLIEDIGLDSNGVIGYQKLKKLSHGLKKLTFEAIKRQPDIVEYEQLGNHILTRLFELYADEQYNKDLLLLPANYRSIDNSNAMIIDYLGGMTDFFAIQQYEKYFGALKDKGIYFK